MPVVKTRNILSGMLVSEVMRCQFIQLPATSSLSKGINHLIKHKINALLVTDEVRGPAGVVSKTDLVGAFYGGLPINSMLGDIMYGPLLTCYPDDALEASLDVMRTHGVHQLYVRGADPSALEGMLSYTDVVVFLHRYCRSCPKSTNRGRGSSDLHEEGQHFTVKEVMTASVISCREDDSLIQVIEGLTDHRLGAIPIRDSQGSARGVVSKTDLVAAYHHGMSLTEEARSIMNTPVVSCDQEALLDQAIRLMLLKDVHRVFVNSGDPLQIAGVLSLSDAARIRSGSCRACVSSRIVPKG
jgi:CBS domain-containing protein